MASDSNSGCPSTTMSGTLPFGLSLRNSGFFCSPLARSTFTFSYGTPSSSSAQWTRVALDIGV